MDKAEYRIKLEQVRACAENGDFQGAAKIADTIDWHRVKSVRTLCMISEIYEADKRYEDGLDILEQAYRRSPQSKTVLYRLADVSVKTGNLSDAKQYYATFEEVAPQDTSRYVLKYKLLRAEKAPLDEQIAVLKEYKDREYTERWAYELARLYKKNGQKQRCIEECDDMILWFAEGRYVTRAMELKMQLVPLSESQKAKYESRLAEAKVAAEREERLAMETRTAADAAEDAEEPAETEQGTAKEPQDDMDDRSGSVSTAEVIEKMNAAADASLQGARSASRMPNVRPAARQSISGRTAGGNDMQNQLASSIREVFSGIRSQTDEESWESEERAVSRRELPEEKPEPEPQPHSEEDADLAELFAETENSIAQSVQAATSDGGEERPEETKHEVAEHPAAEQNTDEEADESEAPSGTTELKAEDLPGEAEEEESEAGKLVGMETDESLGLTREFNFRKELDNLAGSGSEAAPSQVHKDDQSAHKRIPDPEEAAVKIVAESKRQGEASQEEDVAGYENVAELSERLLAGITEIPASGFVTVAQDADGKSNVITAPAVKQQAAANLTPSEAKDRVKSSIIDHLLDEPDMIERMDVVPRTFDDTEKKLFSYFSAIPGIGEQVSIAIADIHNNSGDRTSKSGNVLIVGRRGCGKTKLAESLVLAVCRDLNIPAAKTAKIIASDFNQKDAAAIVKKMAGGFLIIEGAGELSADTVDKLNRAMEFRTDDMVVILEDEKQDMKVLLDKYPEFARKFTSKITIPVFTNDELVTFGKVYAQENGYSFDEMATLALYTMIGENQKNTEPVTVNMVREMVDKAIARSKGRKFQLFSKNQVGPDGRIILREKDFAF